MGMADAREAGVASRRIDDDEVAVPKFGQRRGEAAAILLGGGQRGIEPARLDRDMARDRQRELPRRRAPILHITGEGALAGVEIDAADTHARAQQGDDQMHRRGGFSRATFLVTEAYGMGLAVVDRS